MSKSADGDSLWSRTARLISDHEQARDSDSTEISRQFAQLQRIMIENKDIYPSTEGAKPHNRLKNRYKDVLPYDKCRVILESDRHSDYINASFVEDFYGKRRYIAAQGPIDESVEDFFRMIWELQITSIICVANETEGGRPKFRRYWPDEDRSLQFGSYRISIDENDDRALCCEHFQIRPLIIMQGTNRRHVLLYHFLHWLDHDVPSSEAPVLDLLVQLDKDRTASPDTPILVHCSAGCGRTGSMIAIDICRLLLHDEHLLSSDDYQPYPIFKVASHIRQYRIALIQTIKQYLFVHKMFVHMMQSNGNVLSLSTIHNEQNSTLHSSSSIKPSPPSTISSSTPRRPSGPFNLKLGDPPVGRRSNLKGTNTSNNSSPTVFSPEYYSSSTKPSPSAINQAALPSESPPPPIPPRTSLLNATNKRLEGQFVRPSETPIKTTRILHRSRPVKRREQKSTTPNNNSTTRSDSADALSVPSSDSYHQRPNDRHGIIFYHEPNSD